MFEVKPYKTRYDCGNAYWMARLSHAVYKDKKGSQSPDEKKILSSLKKMTSASRRFAVLTRTVRKLSLSCTRTISPLFFEAQTSGRIGWTT